MSAVSEPVAPAPHVDLPRVLTLRDLVLFNIVAVLSLRWTATAAAAGPSSLTLWVLAGLLFFIPQGLAVSYLGTRFPREGGIYFWTKQAFGEGHGFLCGWCYWINNILYYPNLLMSTAVIGTYMIGRGDTSLMDNWTYILLSHPRRALVGGVAQRGWPQDRSLAPERWSSGHLHSRRGTDRLWPPCLAHPRSGYPDHPANPHPQPEGHVGAESVGLDRLRLRRPGALLGHGRRGEGPTPDAARSIYIAAPFIAFLYIAGTASVLWLVPRSEVHVVSGFFQAMAAGARDLGGLGWIIPVAAAFYVLGNVGGIGAWLTGPARVAFVIGLDRYFPPAFGRVHPRWKTPYVAILTQAVLATIFLLLSVLGKGTTVEKAYLIVLDTMLLIYFIPYIYLFICYLVVRLKEPELPARRGGRAGAWLVGLSGLLLTLGAMLVASIPPSDTADPWLFRLKVIGGAGLFVLLGGVIYWRGRRSGP